VTQPQQGARPRAAIVVLVLGALLALALAPAAGAQIVRVQPLERAGSLDERPFPSDRFTVRDAAQLTGRRVALPRPDCTARPNDCQDVDVLNALDGFNLQPRLSVPFSGRIELRTVARAVFLVPAAGGERIGVSRVSFDAQANVLHAEPDEQLAEGTRYLLVVTRRLRDASGRRVAAAAAPRSTAPAERTYGRELRTALRRARVPTRDVAVASLFTTRTATWLMDRVARRIEAGEPAPARLDLGAGGERTVFALSDLRGVTLQRQVGTAPAFAPAPVPLAAALGDAAGTVAFGTFRSTRLLDEAERIPPVPSRTGEPAAQAAEDVHFTLVLPAGERPAGGWPVAIFGHGFTDSRFGAPLAVARTLAERGLATIAINVVGHGGGPAGTIAVERASGAPVTLPAGGRGIDQDGDGAIGPTEGVSAEAPYALLGSTDGLNQTVADLLGLARTIGAGVDVDADGHVDLDPARITYAGQSFGGIYGTELLGASRTIRTGVLNVPGGPIVEIARLSPVFRPSITATLGARRPSLLNGGTGGFTESVPLRGDGPVVEAPGASAIQRVLDDTEWASQTSNPVAWAPRLRRAPLPGVPAKAVIVQFARGDLTVPNPTTTNIVRAGALADRTTQFRADLAFGRDPAFGTNPHTFLTRIADAPPVAAAARQGQEQIAAFLASDGRTTIDPDGAGPLFETPIAGPLPERLQPIGPGTP
jgi:hypothetical protein